MGGYSCHNNWTDMYWWEVIYVPRIGLTSTDGRLQLSQLDGKSLWEVTAVTTTGRNLLMRGYSCPNNWTETPYERWQLSQQLDGISLWEVTAVTTGRKLLMRGDSCHKWTNIYRWEVTVDPTTGRISNDARLQLFQQLEGHLTMGSYSYLKNWTNIHRWEVTAVPKTGKICTDDSKHSENNSSRGIPKAAGPIWHAIKRMESGSKKIQCPR